MVKNIPKVKFEVASIKHVIPVINHFLNPGKEDWDWSHYILNKYSKLKKELEGIKDKKQREKIAKDFFEKWILSHKKELEKDKKIFQRNWNKINDKYMTALSDILEIDWSKKDKNIRAFISPNPPIYLNQ